MTIDLSRPRAVAESTLTDRASITRANTDAATYDAAALTLTPAAPVVVHADIACSVNSTGETLAPRDGDDRSLTVYAVRVASSITDLHYGDVITLTSVAPGGDTSVVGVPLTIEAVNHGSHQVLRRLAATGVAHNAQAVIR